MSVYKAIIVEDEYWARITLRDKVEDFPEVEVIGEAASVSEGVKLLRKTNPDILFLDVELTDGTGFDLLNKTEYSGKVIFVTAYDSYAIRAFEINALDYLLKPISESRLRDAIGRINKTDLPGYEDFQIDLKADDRLMVTHRNYIHFVKVADIVLISTAQDYTSLHTIDNKEYLVSKSMNEWEKRLPKENFCRIHRSYIINFDFIEKTIKLSPNAANIYLKGFDEPFRVSRSYYHKLKERYI